MLIEKTCPSLYFRLKRFARTACSLSIAASLNTADVDPSRERPRFACRFTKYRNAGFSRERHMLVTSRAIYNFVPGAYTSANRVIALASLTGIVRSSSSEQVLLVYRSFRQLWGDPMLGLMKVPSVCGGYCSVFLRALVTVSIIAFVSSCGFNPPVTMTFISARCPITRARK